MGEELPQPEGSGAEGQFRGAPPGPRATSEALANLPSSGPGRPRSHGKRKRRMRCGDCGSLCRAAPACARSCRGAPSRERRKEGEPRPASGGRSSSRSWNRSGSRPGSCSSIYAVARHCTRTSWNPRPCAPSVPRCEWSAEAPGGAETERRWSPVLSLGPRPAAPSAGTRFTSLRFSPASQASAASELTGAVRYCAPLRVGLPPGG